MATDSMTPKTIKGLIDLELLRIEDKELNTQVAKSVKSAGADLGTLNRYLNALRKRTPKETETAQ